MDTPAKRVIVFVGLLFVLTQLPAYRDAFQQARPFSDIAVVAITFSLLQRR